MSLADDAKLAFINLLLLPPVATKAVPAVTAVTVVTAVNSAVGIITQKIHTRHWLIPMNYQSLFMQQLQRTPHCAKGSDSNVCSGFLIQAVRR